MFLFSYFAFRRSKGERILSSVGYTGSTNSYAACTIVMLLARHDRTTIIRPDNLIWPVQQLTQPVSPPTDAYGKSRPLLINYALFFFLKPPLLHSARAPTKTLICYSAHEPSLLLRSNPSKLHVPRQPLRATSVPPVTTTVPLAHPWATLTPRASPRFFLVSGCCAKAETTTADHQVSPSNLLLLITPLTLARSHTSPLTLRRTMPSLGSILTGLMTTWLSISPCPRATCSSALTPCDKGGLRKPE